MPRLYVVYDTNVYRGMSGSQFDHLVRLERNHSVVGVAAAAVAGELLSHLHDENDDAFRACRAALRRMVTHCRRYNGAKYVLSFIGEVAEQIAHSLIGGRLPRDEAAGHALASLVGHLAFATSNEEVLSQREVVKALADQMRGAEGEFVEIIWRRLILQIHPMATEWSDIRDDPELRARADAMFRAPSSVQTLAGGLVSSAVRLSSVRLDEDAEAAAVAELIARLRGVLRLYRRSLSRPPSTVPISASGRRGGPGPTCIGTSRSRPLSQRSVSSPKALSGWSPTTGRCSRPPMPPAFGARSCR